MPVKTSIYIDGFNLYYGSLKENPSFKWLDLNALFNRILKPYHDINHINYFTANISARNGDAGPPVRQQIYLQALQAYLPNLIIYRGHFLSSTVTMRLAVPLGKQKYAKVIKTEEKGSDVNLAIHALNDAWSGKYECAVIVSNDSDLSEAMRIIKNELRKKIILITPGNPKTRPVSNQLKKWSTANFGISTADLAACQLPCEIPGTNLKKPLTW